MNKPFITFCVCLFGLQAFAQDADEILIRRLADHFIESVEFVVVDKEGKEYPTAKDSQVEGLRLKSPYLDWEYWNGLFNMGMYNLGETLDEPKYQAYAHKSYRYIYEQLPYFLDAQESFKGKPWWSIYPKPSLIQYSVMADLDHYGTMTAGLLDVYVAERDGKHPKSPYFKEYEAQFEKAIKQLNNQLYLEDGTLARTWFYDPSVWIDDMYMMMSFLARYAEFHESEKLFDFAAKQVILFHELLINQNTGLYFHGYYGDVDMLAKVHWGRANGWMFMGMAELLTRLPKDHKDRAQLEKIYKDYVMNIASYQSQTGLWHQILDREDSYLETSCTAMFVFGVARAVNIGLLDKRYASIAEDGWKGLKTQVDAYGDVHGICIGTGMSPSIGYYYDRPTEKNDIHGTGAFFKAAAEYLKMKQNIAE